METYLKPQVENRNRHLTTKWDLARSQLHRQSLLIDRFQKPWTKHSVDRDGRSDHLSGEFFMREAHLVSARCRARSLPGILLRKDRLGGLAGFQ